jgi:hypothetical protein
MRDGRFVALEHPCLIDSIPSQVRLSDVRDALENVETTSNRVYVQHF